MKPDFLTIDCNIVAEHLEISADGKWFLTSCFDLKLDDPVTYKSQRMVSKPLSEAKARKWFLMHNPSPEGYDWGDALREAREWVEEQRQERREEESLDPAMIFSMA